MPWPVLTALPEQRGRVSHTEREVLPRVDTRLNTVLLLLPSPAFCATERRASGPSRDTPVTYASVLTRGQNPGRTAGAGSCRNSTSRGHAWGMPSSWGTQGLRCPLPRHPRRHSSHRLAPGHLVRGHCPPSIWPDGEPAHSPSSQAPLPSPLLFFNLSRRQNRKTKTLAKKQLAAAE